MLLEVREEVEQLEVLLRLGHDVKAFPNVNSFEHATTTVTGIAKQNEGWSRSQGHGQNRRAMPAGLDRAERAMITRSRSRLPRGGRMPRPCSGAAAEGRLPAPAGPDRVRRQRAGNTWSGRQSNNYWSATTYQNNPSNAWNVNFNDGNVKLDVASFFASIHKDTLYGLTMARVADPELRERRVLHEIQRAGAHDRGGQAAHARRRPVRRRRLRRHRG